MIQIKVIYKLLTTHREVHSGSPKYDAVLLVDGYLTVSSQIIETALRTPINNNTDTDRTHNGHLTIEGTITVYHSNRSGFGFSLSVHIVDGTKRNGIKISLGILNDICMLSSPPHQE